MGGSPPVPVIVVCSPQFPGGCSSEIPGLAPRTETDHPSQFPRVPYVRWVSPTTRTSHGTGECSGAGCHLGILRGFSGGRAAYGLTSGGTGTLHAHLAEIRHPRDVHCRGTDMHRRGNVGGVILRE